jgi:protease I
METCIMTKVMILATDGFEQSELMKPKSILEKAGIETAVVSLKAGEIKGWDQKDWGQSVKVDLTLDDASADDFDALLLPGGQINPDILRMNEEAIELIKDFGSAGKPIAAICHAPWLLVEANIIDGRTVTSWPSIRTDLMNAGADVVDREVVTDGNLITSRNPDDIPAFSKALIEKLGVTVDGRLERA